MIAAGENHTVVLDSINTLYGFGKNTEGQLGSQNINEDTIKPVVIETFTSRIVDLTANHNQTLVVTSSGMVYGFGELLNGELTGINNAFKAIPSKDYILILEKDGTVKKYQDGNITVIMSDIVDIDTKNNTDMYQDKLGNIYVRGENTNGQLGVENNIYQVTPIAPNTKNAGSFTMGAGYNNTHIVDNEGFVYSAGINQYGELGNGTRENENIHTLVGERTLKVEPKVKTMLVNDIEELTIIPDSFNVFNKPRANMKEYKITSDDKLIVDVNENKLVAKQEGRTNITIEDTLTGEVETIERIVVPVEKLRIKQIKVNEVLAEATDEMAYGVKVETDEIVGNIYVETIDNTDVISIDGGLTWSENGILNGNIDLPNKITEIEIMVKTSNGTEFTYTLEVEKISKNVDLLELTVDGVNAVPVSNNRYEIAIEDLEGVKVVYGVTKNENAEISIDGAEYTLREQLQNITFDDSYVKEIPVVVKAENGTEQSYMLAIYKKSVVLDLEKVMVNNKEATKISEARYSITVANTITSADILAIANSSLAEVSIDGGSFNIKENTKILTLSKDVTEVVIRVKVNESLTKDYTLEIHRETDNKLNMLIVNGNMVTPSNKEGTLFEVYLPGEVLDAVVRAIAKDPNYQIEIEGFSAEAGETEKTVLLPNVKNTFKIKVTDDIGGISEYTLIISKADSDISLESVSVSNGNFNKDAIKTGDKVYEVKVPANLTTLDITAITGYVNASVKIEEGTYKLNKVIEEVTLTDNETEVMITVKSSSGAEEQNYILKIIKMSDDATLEKVEVDGIAAVKISDDTYEAIVAEDINIVNVYAVSNNNDASVKIDTSTYVLKENSRELERTAKEIYTKIYVKSENGTVKEYNLKISGLPSNTNIDTVIVNGKEATYKDGENRYEVKLEGTSFEVEVTLEDIFAKMVLGNNPEAIGTDKITISKTGTETIIKVLVTAQDGVETREYEIAILEKSDNANIDSITVNGVPVPEGIDANYKTSVKHDVNILDIVATAEEEYSIIEILPTPNNTSTHHIEEAFTANEVVYEIKVTSERGTVITKLLTITRLDGNTDLLNVKVNGVEAALLEDGTYYYKIDSGNEAEINAVAKSATSKVTINSKGISGNNVTETVLLEKERTNVEILVVSEDGTEKTYTLVVEKKSTDNTIKTVTGDDVQKVEIYNETNTIYIYVDEEATNLDAKFIAANKLAGLKLELDIDFELAEIERTFDVNTFKEEGEKITVKAESGEEREYTVFIIKEANLNLKVKVNTEEIPLVDDKYSALIGNGTTAAVILQAENPNQTVVLKNGAGTVLGTAKGTLSVNVKPTLAEETYKIVITSHNGLGEMEYPLVIKQKSKETGIMYMKVDGLGTEKVSTILYKTEVSGKDTYSLEVKAIDPNAKLKLETSEYQTGTLITNISIADGETKDFAVTVESENGEQVIYTLRVQRISSNTDLEIVTVNNTDATYNSDTKTYSVKVLLSSGNANIYVKAKSELAKVVLDNSIESTNGVVTTSKSIPGIGIISVPIRINAQDGTEELRTLDIIVLSDEVGLELVEVDGKEVEADEEGNYEITVSDEFDFSQIHVKAVEPLADIQVNNEEAFVGEGTVSVSKAGKRVVTVPIVVKGPDGGETTYTLTINVISHNTDVLEVLVDNEETIKEEDVFTAYISNNAIKAEANITVFEYANIKYEDKEEQERINFEVDFPQNEETKEVEFTVVAEDGTEKAYTLKLIRKSTDNSIKTVYVDDIELQANPDGTYYVEVDGTNLESNVKVTASESHAKITLGVTSGNNEVEVKCELANKITVIPIKVVSHNGEELNTTLTIKKISSNTDILNLSVDDEKVTRAGNLYTAYIPADATTAKVKITVDEYGKIKYGSEEGIETLEFEVAAENDKTEIEFVVIAENGKREIYKLELIKKSTDNSFKVYVDNTEIQANPDGTYYAEVDVNSISAISRVLANENHTTVTLGTKEGGHDVQDDILLENKVTVVPIKVVSHNGEEKITTLTIEKMSSDISVFSLIVDKEQAAKNENIYEAYISATALTADIEIMVNSLASIEYEGEVKQEKMNFILDVLIEEQTKEIEFTVIAESGAKETYTLKVIRKSTDTSFKTYVNGTETIKLEDDKYYAEVERDNVEAIARVVANENHATVTLGDITDGYDVQNIVQLKDRITVVPIKVVSHNGEEYETTLTIKRVSPNTDLEYVRANNKTATKVDNGYEIYVSESLDKVSMQIKAKDALAIVSRGELSGNIITLDEVELTDVVTTLTVEVTAENGDKKEYKISIIKGSDDNTLKEIYVDDVFIPMNEDGLYVAEVLDTTKEITIKGVTNHEKAYVRIALDNEFVHTAITKMASPVPKYSVIQIVTRSESGITAMTNLYIKRISTNTNVALLTIDGKEVTDYDSKTNTYTYIVESYADMCDMFVMAESNYAVIEYYGEENDGSFNTLINIPSDKDGITVEFTIKSEVGGSKTYKVDIVKKSTITDLEHVKLNDKLIYPKNAEQDVYEERINVADKTAKIEVKTVLSYASIRIGDEPTQKGIAIADIELDEDAERAIIPVVITAPDGTTIKTYNIVLVRFIPAITGKIITKNIDDEHIGTINVTKTDGEQEESGNIETNKDGTFELELAEGTYTLTITKPGYLKHIVLDIETKEKETVELEDINLRPGDINKDDLIDARDFALIGAKNGVSVENTKYNVSYDFNEDEIIDLKDRELLKSHYGTKVTIETWVKPEIEAASFKFRMINDFIIPVTTNYEITSKWGMRAHPVTGVYKRHTGIDIVPEHHSEIVAAASGTVTFAGVQDGFGNSIEIKHVIDGETIYTFYAHLSKIELRKGEEILQGERIGLEGGGTDDENRGLSTGHHLHFEIREASGYGNDINPNDYLSF